MNLRKDHYRVAPRNGRAREGEERSRRGAGRGDGGAGPRGPSPAPLPTPARAPRGTRRRDPGGRPSGAEGPGERPLRAALPRPRHPRGEPSRRQAEPGTARAPPPFTRGGGGGPEGLEASSPGAPREGGARPSARPLEAEEGEPGAGPPLRSEENVTSPLAGGTEKNYLERGPKEQDS